MRALLLCLLVTGCYDFNSLSKQFTDDASAFPSHCSNRHRDGDESDIDCGGSCPGCPDGAHCTFGSDCVDRLCSNNTCLGASCTDHVQNGDETDIDCGFLCPGCGLGKMCHVGSDCLSMACTNDRCAMPPCMNGMKDGTETDVDCGGTCPACGDGKMCLSGNDCYSAMCTNNVCKSNCATGTADCTGPGCGTMLDTDVKNCGACGKVCPMSLPVCTSGKCVTM